MRILKIIILVLLFLSLLFFVSFFIRSWSDISYKPVYRLSRNVFIALFIIYTVVYFISLARAPIIKKREIVKGFDTDTTKDKNFPSVFR